VSLKPGVSGFVCVRNALQLDYPVSLAVLSLIPHCDEVIVCDSDSDDGTTEALKTIALIGPKTRYLNRPWNQPHAQIDWWVQWLNWTREQCQYDRYLYLDADEVLSGSGEFDRDKSYWVRRNNFWRDAHHTVPPGRCCADWVVRYGPTDMTACSDEMYGDDPNMLHAPEPEVRKIAVRHPTREIMHYGFLRKREALFRKVETCIRYWFGGSQDSRLIEAEKHPDVHWTTFCQFDQPLIPFTGSHPEIAREWLKERGAL
jgi:glycosyltransferase involved in cell wall biosynthesis